VRRQIPANRVGNKWLFNKEDVDNWVRSNRPIETFFIETPAHIEENLQLRKPQIEAYQALYEFFRNGGKTQLSRFLSAAENQELLL
jgi:DNA repair protein RadD